MNSTGSVLTAASTDVGITYQIGVEWAKTRGTTADWKITYKIYLKTDKDITLDTDSDNNVSLWGGDEINITASRLPKGVNYLGSLSEEMDSNYADNYLSSVTPRLYIELAILINDDIEYVNWVFEETLTNQTDVIEDITNQPPITAKPFSALVGSSAAIILEKQEPSYKATIDYQFGTKTGRVGSNITSTVHFWTVPGTLLYEFAASEISKNGTLTVTTYSKGGVLIGTTSCSFTLVVDSSVAGPKYYPTIEDTNTKTIALTGDKNKLIKFYSHAYVDTGAQPVGTGVTLDSVVTVCGKQSFTGLTGTLIGIDDNVIKITGKDSRGLTSTETITLDSTRFIDYVKLSCNLEADIINTNGEVTFNVSGNYFNGSFGATSNTLTVYYRYRKLNEDFGSWIPATATRSGNTYNYSVTLTGLDYTQIYSLQARATDKLVDLMCRAVLVTGRPVYDWSKQDFNFNVPVNINGDLVVNGTIISNDNTTDEDGNVVDLSNYYTKTEVDGLINSSMDLSAYPTRLELEQDYFDKSEIYELLEGNIETDLSNYYTKSEVYSKSEVYDKSQVYNKSEVDNKIAAINTGGGGTGGSGVEFGTWTPTCNVCPSPIAAQGRYIKIGDIIIANFYYKGTPIQETTYLYFDGLPFQSKVMGNRDNQGGGGYILGAIPTNTSAVFMGWVAYGTSVLPLSNNPRDASNEMGYYFKTIAGTAIECSGTIMYSTTI